MTDELKPGPDPRKKRALLKAFAELGVITRAAHAAGCSARSVHRWRAEDPEFAAQFEEAKEEAIEHLEAEARRRAVEGTLRPVFHQGEQCGVIREYSDTLLIFLLKGAKPEKYRDNHAVNVGGQIDTTAKIDYGRRVPCPAEVEAKILAAADRIRRSEDGHPNP